MVLISALLVTKTMSFYKKNHQISEKPLRFEVGNKIVTHFCCCFKAFYKKSSFKMPKKSTSKI